MVKQRAEMTESQRAEEAGELASGELLEEEEKKQGVKRG
jgi:hypothetical protein